MAIGKPVTDLSALPDLPPGVSLVDSHCHLDMEALAVDREGVVERARRRGVTRMITIGAGGPFECNPAAVELAETVDEVYATVGIHPHDAVTVNDKTLAELRRLAESPRVVGIGETGLDFHYDHSPRDVQEEAFRRFIDMARELCRPLVVHLREATDAALRVLREERAGEIGGVIHSFSGGPEEARAFLDLGFHLSFSGIITFRTAEDLRAAARIVPSDRLLVETDAPFLAPVPFRGRRNEPALVIGTAACVAEVRGESLAGVARSVWENAARLFGLTRA
jgi:TatD DNase family protein